MKEEKSENYSTECVEVYKELYHQEPFGIASAVPRHER